MDLLIEKGDSRTYLSQLKVLVTKFEEGAPAITRNSTQIQGRNGNVDFGGWHTSKEIEVEGFYRADDLDEETILRERLYALLSDTDGFYITEMRGELTPDFERPGENEGNLYEQLTTRPSHKRFFVYAKSVEPELQGNIGGAVLYKLTMTFITMKLPYGESVPRDLAIKLNVPYYGKNLMINTTGNIPPSINGAYSNSTGSVILSSGGETSLKVTGSPSEFYYRFMIPKIGEMYGFNPGSTYVISGKLLNSSGGKVIIRSQVTGGDGAWHSITETEVKPGKFSAKIPIPLNSASFFTSIQQLNFEPGYEFSFSKIKIESGETVTPYSPSPSDPGYNKWYLNTYYNTDNLVIPYAGTVPCSQLEQGFIIEFTAKEGGSGLKVDLNGTKLTYSGQVYSDDVFKLSGYEYTKNGISIVKSTNKAYFKLLPGITNKISSSLAGEIRILNFQNLYA
ncbi:phage tail domain-containing protein [Lactiplantibacillus plantarum]|uniref:phage tail domain-containing protein n=1 Tax=Lactiplantibacillus plantarum TaxID=1590 RepID=UPI001B83A9B3|nr:phage tail domain-containing protein [Lactiplantibacillus plantarum]GIQ95218.1 hypothetical protein COY2906_20880 [Lactiplantibacillus plantarum]